MPAGHPLAQVERITLEDLALQPLVSYHPSFSGRTRIDQAFAARRLKPNIVLEAIDADVIKTYVRLGLGVGIVAEMAVRDDPPGGDLVWRPGRPPVRPERHPRRLQARRLPAQLRLRLRRDAVRPADAAPRSRSAMGGDDHDYQL